MFTTEYNIACGLYTLKGIIAANEAKICGTKNNLKDNCVMMINKYYEGSENEDFEKEVTCVFASLTLVKVMGRGNYIWEKGIILK